MVKDVVIKGEFTTDVVLIVSNHKSSIRWISPWDVVNAVSFYTVPTSLLDVSCDLGELVGRNFASPIGLYGLFDLTVTTYEAYISRW